MRALLFSALSLALAAHGPHHPHPHQAPAPAKVHKAEKVGPSSWVIFGQGGNIGLVVTDRYAVLIDDQFERLAPGLLETVRGLTDKPIRYLINTHHHGDHTGANAVLEKQVMAIAAHANVRRRLVLGQAKLEPAKRGGLPEITVGEEDPSVRARAAFHLDGQEVVLLHVAPGHTDGDVIVWMPQQKVLHMGDLFFNGMTPFVDLGSGGSLEGMIANAEAVLAFLPEDARVIPGHGPMGGRKDLARYRDFLKAVQAHLKAHPGMTGKELDAAFDHKAWSDFTDIKGFIDWAGFFDILLGREPQR